MALHIIGKNAQDTIYILLLLHKRLLVYIMQIGSKYGNKIENIYDKNILYLPVTYHLHCDTCNNITYDIGSQVERTKTIDKNSPSSQVGFMSLKKGVKVSSNPISVSEKYQNKTKFFLLKHIHQRIILYSGTYYQK